MVVEQASTRGGGLVMDGEGLECLLEDTDLKRLRECGFAGAQAWALTTASLLNISHV